MSRCSPKAPLAFSQPSPFLTQLSVAQRKGKYMFGGQLATNADKLISYMMADVALKRKEKGLKLNYSEAVAIISATALDGARAARRSKT